MTKRLLIEKYGVESYDDFLCLKPSKRLIVALIFLCRGLIVLGLIGLSDGVPAGLTEIVDGETLWLDCVAAVPAALLLYALGRRVPTAGAFVRRVWRHGRALTTLSASSYVAIAIMQIGTEPRHWLGGGSVAIKALVLIELGIVAYVLL